MGYGLSEYVILLQNWINLAGADGGAKPKVSTPKAAKKEKSTSPEKDETKTSAGSAKSNTGESWPPLLQYNSHIHSSKLKTYI